MISFFLRLKGDCNSVPDMANDNEAFWEWKMRHEMRLNGGYMVSIFIIGYGRKNNTTVIMPDGDGLLRK